MAELTLSSGSDSQEATTITISDTDESVVYQSSSEDGDRLSDFKGKQKKKKCHKGIKENSNESDNSKKQKPKDRRKEGIKKKLDSGTKYDNNDLSLDNSKECNTNMSWNSSSFRKRGITTRRGLNIIDKMDSNDFLNYGIQNDDDSIDDKLKRVTFKDDKNDSFHNAVVKSVETENSFDRIRSITNYWLNVNKAIINGNATLDTNLKDDSFDLLIEDSFSDNLENRIKKKLNLPNEACKSLERSTFLCYDRKIHFVGKDNSCKNKVKKKQESRDSSELLNFQYL